MEVNFCTCVSGNVFAIYNGTDLTILLSQLFNAIVNTHCLLKLRHTTLLIVTFDLILNSVAHSDDCRIKLIVWHSAIFFVTIYLHYSNT